MRRQSKLIISNYFNRDRPFFPLLSLCSIRGVWTHGVLWYIFQSDHIFNRKVAAGHSHLSQQCHQLGWNNLDYSHFRCLLRWCSSRPILDVCHCLHYLHFCKSLHAPREALNWNLSLSALFLFIGFLYIFLPVQCSILDLHWVTGLIFQSILKYEC